jgi:hypothetical protein
MKEFLMNKKIIHLALLSIITFFPSGCTYNVPLIDASLPQKPLIEKLPITMGIYYSDEFRSYEWSPPVPSSSGSHYRITLGPPSVTLFDQIFSEMFEKVIQAKALPPLLQAQPDSKAVIEPEIDVLNINTDRQKSWIQFDLTYKITLYGLNGAAIANWSIRGSGSSVSALKSINHPAMVREAAQIAMRDVAAQFILGFRRNPEAMEWLRSLGITASY